MKTKTQVMYKVTAYSKEQSKMISDFFDRGILPAGVTDANELLDIEAAAYYIVAADINAAVRLFKEHYTQYDVHLGSIQFVGYVLTEE